MFLELETILAVHFLSMTTCMAQHVLEELYRMRARCHFIDFGFLDSSDTAKI